ncbi:helix-turn-helix domain-containing protein [Pseudoprimorskyibacter insulae]|uniref:Transcriptional repressor IclR n=1 Tax=Pseudoprimorskyibacter insulae TaxID=1695997 RepID=A0A2R8ATZ7_9RHOB|nr:helix-turn-helix domain-containing protein [Pseudoprimorskyibacter insulae]SPF79521.1 Transcriptional repressor IclR [Pseudoprimorskyibacter insulae]
MKTPQVKSIQSLARGLEVLQLLQTTGGLALADLHRLSGIPKASLLRILKTLLEQGAIWQRMADNAYIPSYALSELARRMDRESELAEAASPVLERLSEAVKWPSVLAVPRVTHMEVIETNASRAMIDNIPLGPVGFQINMLRSASGRAYIANCEDAVREATLERLRRSRRPGDRWARSPDYVDQILRDTRKRGYALRDLDFGGDYDNPRRAADDARDSLGVAIRLGSHVPGAINVTWARRVFTRDAAIAHFAEPVMQAALDIAQRMNEDITVSPGEI